MSTCRRVVLLSGGLDSAAALHWAQERGHVEAVGFRYGQPHERAELDAATRIAERRRVPFRVLDLGDLGRLDPAAGCDDRGVSRSFLPCRNPLFLTRSAMAFAMPRTDLHLVIGANNDDARGFPDCRAVFFGAAQEALRAALLGVCDVHIETPWIALPKTEIVRWCASRPLALADARDSVSCYRGTRCGLCDACTLRARAFVEADVEDVARGDWP